MSKLTFNGGIFSPLHKELTENIAIKSANPPKRVVIPLKQHMGKDAVPVIKKGDYILEGQKIGELQGKLSACIHSSISGKVRDICFWNHPIINEPVLSVVIESDGHNVSSETKKTYWDYFRYSNDEIIKLIQESGVVGMGGEGYPVSLKLSSGKEIDTVIINGCESEPYVTCDDRLMREYPVEIIEGLKIIMHILDVHKGFIAIEDNKTEAIISLRKEAFTAPNVTIKTLKTKYPQGAQKQLIKALLNKVVPLGKTPEDIGVAVWNVATAYSIQQAVIKGVPLISRVVTVTGDCLKYPGNYNVKIGTLLSDLLEQCGYEPSKNANKIIVGGPMKGIAQTVIDVPIIKTTSSIVVLEEKESSILNDYQPCVKCGKCITVCPAGLMPNFISLYAENSLWDKCREFYPADCIECGCCSYECIAKRPIVQHIKLAKMQT